MEPFGLFHLLQSLLPTEEKEGEKTAPPPDEPPPPPPDEKPNACADFFTAHEKRAGRKKSR